MLTQARLKELLHYDPETGVFTWRRNYGRVRKGTRAGYQEPCGRIQIRVDGRLYRAHRLAWLYKRGEWPRRQIDHRDGDHSNNRWKNLRSANNAQNQWNAGRSKNNSSGRKGVHRRNQTGRWRAFIGLDNRQKYLGDFDTFEEAAAARLAAEKQHHGVFRRIHREEVPATLNV